MDPVRRAETRRRAFRVGLLFTSSALAAFALSAGLRAYLPYEALRSFTAEEQFQTWEGALWMLGLAMVFLGGAGALGTLHLGRMRIPDLSEIHTFSRDTRPAPFQFSLIPWWVLSTGTVLLVIAIQARGQMAG